MNRIIRSLAVPAIGLALASAGCESMPWNKNDSSDEKKAVAVIKPAKAASTRPAWGNPGGTVTFTEKGADKVHVEDVLVERYGFSGVLAAIGDVVDLLNNTHRFLLRANLLAQISNRCY